MATRRILVELIGDERSLTRAFSKGGKDAKHFDTTIKSITRSTGGFSRGFLSGAGALSSFGGALALTSGSFFAGAGIVAGLKASVSAASTFEQTMNVLGQVSGATADQLSRAGDEARALGADISLPATSASDAAKAMLELAKGGLTLKESMDAARGTLQLAAAAQTDVATAADETARALTTFGLSGSAAGKIADLLANGAQSATGDINDFALALSQSGTSAHQFGLSATDTVAALTELAKAGILGSDAGTSLRVMLTRLLPTSKAAQREIKRLGIEVADSSGHFRPFREIVDQYAKALSTLTPKQRQFALQTIFGTDAQRAANIILGQGVQNFDSLTQAVSKQGGAARAAAAQQKGFKGALDGFNSALQTTEVTVGTALLPTLTKYLRSAATWLGTTDHQKEIQGKVTTAVNETTHALKEIIGGVKTVDSTFGGLVETLKFLVALKVATKLAGAIGPITRLAGALGALQTARSAKGVDSATKSSKQLAKEAKLAEARSAALRGTLLRLGGIGVITLGIEVIIHKDQIDKAVGGFLDKHHLGFLGGTKEAKLDVSGLNLSNIDKAIDKAHKLGDGFIAHVLEGLKNSLQKQQDDALKAAGDIVDRRVRGSGHGAKSGPILNGPGGTVTDTTATTVGKPLTAAQRNTFFDNALARVLLRGGLGNINEQIAALNRASQMLTARIAITKDVTRKANLEDQLLQIAAQKKDLQRQQVQSFLDALQFKVDVAGATAGLNDDLRALKALQAAIQQRIKVEGKTLELQQQLFSVRQQIEQTQQEQTNRQQFFQLGLGPTGGDRVPLAKTLRRQLANVSAAVEGTFLDTNKTRSVLANIKRVLGSGIKGVSSEVRSAIKQMLDDIDQQLKQHAGDQTKFKHANANALLAGLGLSPDEIKKIRGRLATVGVGGTVPPGHSAAFSKSGTVQVDSTIVLDGQKVGKSTTNHQQKDLRRRKPSRRG